jgi:hypothetical protein
MEAERETRREEVPSCQMCRAALHKLCERVDVPTAPCRCDCERGY